MRIKIPWSEIATLGALYVAAARWSHASVVTVGGATALALAIVCAWVPRGAARHDGVDPAGESLLAASACAAVALATFFTDAAMSRPMLLVRAVTLGFTAAGLVFTSLRLGRDGHPRVGGLVPSVIVGLAVGLSLVPGGLAPPWNGLAPAVVLPLIAFVFAARYELTPVPSARARFVIPGATAGAAAGLVAVASIARHGHPDVALALFALAVVLAVAGLSVAVHGGALAWRGRVARGVAALLVGGLAAAIAALLVDDVALAAAGGVLGGTVVAIAAGSGAWRPDRGRLLEACVRAGEKATGAERMDDLAAAVLDPLRVATRDLQARTELWVLPFEARFVLDVSGAARRTKLSPSAERALLAWMRTRSSDVLFTDVLRPLEVRRAEVRPVLAALIERDAFAVVPLTDAGELIGAIFVPRGRRDALPTLDEEQGLERLGGRVSAALALVMSLERARDRASEAVSRAQSADVRAESAVQERDRALSRLRGVRAVRAVGTLEDAWVGYGDAMRRFEAQVRALASQEVPVALVTEAGMAMPAVATLLHAHSTRAAEACVIVDASEVHPRDALATLVGTLGGNDDEDPATGAVLSPSPGWLELVQSGTLVILDAPALGADAHVALLEAMKSRVARRLGGGAPYEVTARIVITARDALMHTGLPTELCDCFAASTLLVPSLRERPEDVETLVLFAIDRACRLHGRGAIGIHRDALQTLREYAWPENERELFQALEHAVRVARGAQLVVDDLPDAVRAAPGRLGGSHEADGETYDALDRRILQAALERSNGNKSEAARALGLARTTFLDKLRKYGLRG